MKRDRFTSDYDRVRKDSGYARLHVKSEFPESTIDAHGRTVEDRVEAMRLEVHEKIGLAQAGEQEAERRAEGARWHRNWRASVDEAIMRAEYRSFGIQPPTPICSLGLLLKIGWTIEPIGDKNVLVRPVTSNEAPRRTRADYAQKPDDFPNDEIPF